MDVSGKNKLMSQHMEIKVRKWTLERGSKVTVFIILQYNKKYEINEFYQRLQTFLENKKKIERHNAGNHKFSSMTDII